MTRVEILTLLRDEKVRGELVEILAEAIVTADEAREDYEAEQGRAEALEPGTSQISLVVSS